MCVLVRYEDTMVGIAVMVRFLVIAELLYRVSAVRCCGLLGCDDEAVGSGPLPFDATLPVESLVLSTPLIRVTIFTAEIAAFAEGHMFIRGGERSSYHHDDHYHHHHHDNAEDENNDDGELDTIPGELVLLAVDAIVIPASSSHIYAKHNNNNATTIGV
ncbi:unnamed protein product [Nippostrongylus brasiliensis]|uniref:Secreted protein n=1 Tax=Nippostrongylus brasiliensis TaxID=27835 RepID=A0A0N4YF43_NIPBR|nr:unnamed protein product [Nippostrongylus brasiliensis]